MVVISGLVSMTYPLWEICHTLADLDSADLRDLDSLWSALIDPPGHNPSFSVLDISWLPLADGVSTRSIKIMFLDSKAAAGAQG
jgi:hypothetical protein